MRYIEVFRDVYCPYCGALANLRMKQNGETKDGYYEGFHCYCGARFSVELIVEEPADDKKMQHCREEYVKYWESIGFDFSEEDAFTEYKPVYYFLPRRRNDDDEAA